MTISPWLLVLLAIPILVLGEFLVKRSPALSRFNIPAPVVGGLIVSLLVWLCNFSHGFPCHFQTEIAERWWTWPVSAGPEWTQGVSKGVSTPFLLAFLACLGLGADWRLLKRGGVQALAFLGLAGLLAVIQNGVGVAMAKALDLPPLMGLVCGSLSLTGGHVTASSFAADFQKAGLPDAQGTSMGVATFGIVTSAVVGGVIAGVLIQRRKLQPSGAMEESLRPAFGSGNGLLHDLRSIFFYGGPFLAHLIETAKSGVLADIRELSRAGRSLLVHLLLVLGCVKLGAWLNWSLEARIGFPVYLGAMVSGILVRNLIDLSGGKWLRPEVLDSLSSVTLGFFMTIALMSLNLIELSHGVAPVMIILLVQVVVMALFAWFVTFRVMGRDFDAAVMTSGHVGFGLGETPNAVANMKALVENFGPAPRAFLVVAVGSSFLIKVLNSLNIAVFLNWFKP